jgi:hypothetical protein
VTGCIIDAAEVFAWCAKLFPFARSDAAAPATAITVGDMKQALFVLPITPFSFRTSWKRRSIATHRLGLRTACGSNEKSHPAERPRDLAIERRGIRANPRQDTKGAQGITRDNRPSRV